MNKTKIIILAALAVVLAVLAVLGVRYSDKFLPETTMSEDTQSKEETATAKETGTIVPLVEAQTQILNETTTKPQTVYYTERYDENATRLSQESGWKDNDLTIGLPKIKTGSVSTVNYISDKGRRTVIRIDSFDYASYLNYIEKLEKAGFADNNGGKHIPESAPATVAMFYNRFDGSRSFGVYWYGSESAAGFDCEIVISDYDQAK